MSWGVYMLDAAGNPWVTPNSTPMAFLRKFTVNTWGHTGDSRYQKVDLGVSASDACMPFYRVRNSLDADGPYVVLSDEGNWKLAIIHSTYARQPVALDIYVFSIFPQPLPKWGAVVFNERGIPIMTNETRPLRILKQTELNRHIGLSDTLPGSCAIMPSVAGVVGSKVTVGDGDNRPALAEFTYSCNFDGSQTRINTLGYYKSIVGTATDTQFYGLAVPVIQTGEYDA